MAWVRFALASGFALTLLVTASAGAVDGVIEINQDKALAGGVTGLDTAGFPVTLVGGFSYRLTSDLVIFDDDITVIDDDVPLFGGGGTIHLDLNGFSGRCQGGILSSNCRDGAGSGIDFDQVANVTIRNGSVISMGRYGIRVTTAGARIDAIHATNNGNSSLVAGVRCASSCLITNSVASGNNGYGFFADDGAVIRDSIASNNLQTGIRVGIGCSVTGTAVHDNSQTGIDDGGGGMYAHNAIHNNVGEGIRSYSAAAGFAVGHNAFFNNNGAGDEFSAALGVQVGPNLCNASTVCP